MEKIIAKCPLCGEKIKLNAKTWIGQEIECPACDALLEVSSVKPVSLDWLSDDEAYFESAYESEYKE